MSIGFIISIEFLKLVPFRYEMGDLQDSMTIVGKAKSVEKMAALADFLVTLI